MLGIYIFPKHLNETALKCIGRYLKPTRDQGFILNPSSNFCMLDFYPDAIFFGMYGYELTTDPDFIKSRTGLVITFADDSFYWASNL